MKQPRFRLTIDVTLDEYLALLWAIDGLHGDGWRPQKNTIRKIASFDREFTAKYYAWKAKHFKCAGAGGRASPRRIPGRRKNH